MFAWMVGAALLFGCNDSTAEAPKPDEHHKTEATAKKEAPKAPAKAPARSASPEAPAVLAKDHPLHPKQATAKAPDVYRARFTTTKGDFVIEVRKEWAERGADRFYNLVKMGYYDDVALFRAVDKFMVQLGIHGEPAVNAAWRGAMIKDDAVVKSNTRGMVSFATSGKNSRTTQFFVNYVDRNAFLDPMGFSPFGQVVEGMDVVDSLYKGYGDGPPRGRGPNQGRMQSEGNPYLKAEFPELDWVTKAVIE